MPDTRFKGRIIKGISGFYYVYVVGSGLYECKAKGAFRNKGMKPLVGDYVTISVTDEAKKLGNVDEIHTRKNDLIRPNVANVDQALVIFAASKPVPNLNLLDRFLVMMDYEELPVVICFNKIDLCENGEAEELRDIYERAGFKVLLTSVKENIGIDELKEILKDKTTTVAGPSGVGKSSLTNSLQKDIVMETGALSEKIERGKNTTRHSQCIPIFENTYLMDTPGFSSLMAPEIEAEDLRLYFPEFLEHMDNCRFQGCIHMNEPDCAVKDALQKGIISESRYDNYRLIYEEIKGRKKY